MRVQFTVATPRDVASLIALRTEVAESLTAQFGKGPWSRTSTERGLLSEMGISQLYVASVDDRIVATLRLATRKPWAIDLDYFHAGRLPLYLQSIAVTPTLQRQGIGRRCMEEAVEICRRWPANTVRLDAYDAAAGAGPFYQKCGFAEVGRKIYRGCPLVYYERLL